MTQNMRNQPSDSQRNSGRESNSDAERKSYEGFEGMNYEQRRQPYNPQHISNDENEQESSGKRHGEV